MDTESVDDSTQSSVSSLKSRFEQLATRDVKNGPDDKSSPQLPSLRPATASADHRPSLEEQPRPRASFDGTISPLPFPSLIKLMPGE